MVVMLLTFLANLGGVEGANCPALVYGDTVNTITASCTFLPTALSSYNGDARNGQLITGPAALTNNNVLKISGPVAGDFKVEVRYC